MLLVIYSNITTAILSIPGEAVTIIGQDAWIAMILATALAAILVFYPLADLGKRYPGKTIIQYSEDILGKYIGKFFGLIFVYLFWEFNIWTLREYAELASLVMPYTPMEVFIIVMGLLSAYAAYQGIEVIGRCAEFVFPIVAFFLLFTLVVSFRDMDYNNLLPVMESNSLTYLHATMSPLDWLSTGFVFGVFTATVRNPAGLTRIGLLAVMLGGFILTLFTIVITGVLGPEQLERINMPLLILAQNILLPGFARIDILIVIAWVAGISIRCFIHSYIFVASLAQLFNLKDYNYFLILAITAFAIPYSIIRYDSYVEMTYLLSVARYYYFIIMIGLPLILWIISLNHRGSGE